MCEIRKNDLRVCFCAAHENLVYYTCFKKTAYFEELNHDFCFKLIKIVFFFSDYSDYGI